MNRTRRGKPLLAMLLVLGGAALVIGAANEPANDFHFSVVGDRNGGEHPGIYPRIWSEIDLLQPQFVITVGDAIQGYVRDEAQLTERTNAMWDDIDSVHRPYRQLPLYYTTGNHDIWNDASEKIYRERTGQEPNYAFTYHQALFIVLDNSRTPDLSDEVYEFLEAQLKAYPDRSPKFIFFHRPFWLGYIASGDKTARLHQLCKQYGVNWVISGHLHRLSYHQFDGVQYLDVGSSGGTIGKHADGSPKIDFGKGTFFHHAFIRVKGNQVKVMIKELSGRAGSGRMFPIEAWRGSTPAWPADTDIYDNPQTWSTVGLFGVDEKQPVPRGVVPIMIVDAGQTAEAPPLRIQETPVAPQAKAPDFVGVAMEVYDLNSTIFINNLYVNDELVGRMSPNRDLKPWSWYAMAVPKEIWTRQTPPVIKITAGTGTDGSGDDPADVNNDDYKIRNLFASDGEQIYRASSFNNGEYALGDNTPGAKTVATFVMDANGPPPPGRLTLFEWDTRDLAAGRYVLTTELGRGYDSLDVALP